MGTPKYSRKPHTKEVKIGEAFARDDRIGVAMLLSCLADSKVDQMSVLEPKC